MRTDTAVGFCTNDLSINELALVTRQTKYLNTTCPPVLQSAVSPHVWSHCIKSTLSSDHVQSNNT